MATKLTNIAAPNLPLATVEYERLYQDQLNNVLRLFFNQETNAVNILISAYLTNNTVYTVATLPKASTLGAGARSFVSDSTTTTFAGTLTGGGAYTVPVYSDGTSWRIG